MKIIDEQRKKTWERVAKHRTLKKQTSMAASPSSPAYKSTQALGKAVARASSSIPQTPRRLHAACRKLVDRFTVQPNMLSTTPRTPPVPHNKVSEETILTLLHRSGVLYPC